MDADAIREWMREEAIRREREVQEAQVRVEAEREALVQRRLRADAAGGKPARALVDLLEQKGARPDTQDLIEGVCDEIKTLLLEKNAQYGDSAIHPVRIFSKADPAEQLLVRLDDKLSRIARGDDRLESDEDVLNDLIGYLILYKVAKLRASS